jgi:hypothetical protein
MMDLPVAGPGVDIENLQAYLDQALVQKFVEIDDTGELVHGVQTDDELYLFVRAAMGYVIPRKVITEGFSSPFIFVADLFFERVKNALAFASRNGSKTLSVSILNFLDMFFKPGCEICSAGAVRDQARKAYSYFTEFLELPWFKEWCKEYERVTGRKFVKKTTSEITEFDNGSKLQIITATDRGLRSPHPHKARIDEIDLIDWNTLMVGLSMARSTTKGKGGAKVDIRGQNVFTSTRQQEHGSMNKMLSEAKERGIEVYQWNIWEAVEKCERRCKSDPKHGSCPIYAFCKGKAHSSDGFYDIEDFIDKARLLDKETFDVEWLNLKPSRAKLVYWMFDENKHIMTPEKLLRLCGVDRPQRVWFRVSGVDFGASPGHPFVYLKVCQLPTGQWLVFHEYVKEQGFMSEHAQRIKDSPLWLPSERIYADYAGAQERVELRKSNIKTKDANKSVTMGLDFVGQLFKGFLPDFRPQLFVWHECTELIKELNSYSWPVKPNGEPDRSGVPEKKNDNCCDALRYALYTFNEKPRMGYRGRRRKGV